MDRTFMTKRITEIEAFIVTYSRGPVQKKSWSLPRSKKNDFFKNVVSWSLRSTTSVTFLSMYPTKNKYIHILWFFRRSDSVISRFSSSQGHCGFAKSVSPGALSTPSFLRVWRIESISSSVISLHVKFQSCVDHRHDSTSWAIEYIVSITR